MTCLSLEDAVVISGTRGWPEEKMLLEQLMRKMKSFAIRCCGKSSQRGSLRRRLWLCERVPWPPSSCGTRSPSIYDVSRWQRGAIASIIILWATIPVAVPRLSIKGRAGVTMRSSSSLPVAVSGPASPFSQSSKKCWMVACCLTKVSWWHKNSMRFQVINNVKTIICFRSLWVSFFASSATYQMIVW